MGAVQMSAPRAAEGRAFARGTGDARLPAVVVPRPTVTRRLLTRGGSRFLLLLHGRRPRRALVLVGQDHGQDAVRLAAQRPLHAQRPAAASFLAASFSFSRIAKFNAALCSLAAAVAFAFDFHAIPTLDTFVRFRCILF